MLIVLIEHPMENGLSGQSGMKKLSWYKIIRSSIKLRNYFIL